MYTKWEHRYAPDIRAGSRPALSRERGPPVKFGFYLPNSDPPRAENIVRLYEEILEMCERGEALGYSCCVASEHHGLENGFIPSPLIELAAIAGRTSTLELTT